MKSLRITKLMAILLLVVTMTACGNDSKDSNITEDAKVSVELADLLEDTAPTEATQPSEPGTSEVPEGSADKISSEDNEKTPSKSDKADKTDKPSSGASNKDNDNTKKPTEDKDKSGVPTNPAPSEPNPNSASSDAKTNQDKPSSGGSDKKSEVAEEEDDTSEDEKPASGTTTGRPGIPNSGAEEISKPNIGATIVSNCSRCGRVRGNGTGGTCKRWLLDGIYTCTNCGVSVPGKTCHTCG